MALLPPDCHALAATAVRLPFPCRYSHLTASCPCCAAAAAAPAAAAGAAAAAASGLLGGEAAGHAAAVEAATALAAEEAAATEQARVTRVREVEAVYIGGSAMMYADSVPVRLAGER